MAVSHLGQRQRLAFGKARLHAAEYQFVRAAACVPHRGPVAPDPERLEPVVEQHQRVRTAPVVREAADRRHHPLGVLVDVAVVAVGDQHAHAVGGPDHRLHHRRVARSRSRSRCGHVWRRVASGDAHRFGRPLARLGQQQQRRLCAGGAVQVGEGFAEPDLADLRHGRNGLQYGRGGHVDDGRRAGPRHGGDGIAAGVERCKSRHRAVQRQHRRCIGVARIDQAQSGVGARHQPALRQRAPGRRRRRCRQRQGARLAALGIEPAHTGAAQTEQLATALAGHEPLRGRRLDACIRLRRSAAVEAQPVGTLREADPHRVAAQRQRLRAGAGRERNGSLEQARVGIDHRDRIARAHRDPDLACGRVVQVHRGVTGQADHGFELGVVEPQKGIDECHGPVGVDAHQAVDVEVDHRAPANALRRQRPHFVAATHLAIGERLRRALQPHRELPGGVVDRLLRERITQLEREFAQTRLRGVRHIVVARHHGRVGRDGRGLPTSGGRAQRRSQKQCHNPR